MTTTGTFAGRLYATGNGTVVNAATLGGALVIGPPTGFAPALPAAGNTPASATNTGSAAGGLSGYAPIIVNTGTLGSAMLAGYAVQVSGAGPLTFTNSGTVVGRPYRYSSNFPGPATVALSGQDALFFTNTGTITGNGVSLTVVDVRADQPGTLTVQNGGTITGASGSAALTLGLYGNSVNPGAIYTVANSGTISGTATGTADYDAVTGIALVTYSTQPSSSFTLANTGIVGAVGGSRSARAVSVGNVGTAHPHQRDRRGHLGEWQLCRRRVARQRRHADRQCRPDLRGRHSGREHRDQRLWRDHGGAAQHGNDCGAGLRVRAECVGGKCRHHRRQRLAWWRRRHVRPARGRDRDRGS